MTTNKARISALLQQVNQNATDLERGDDRARDGIVEACQSLIREVERPSDTYSRLTLGYLPALMALRTGIDLGLFQQLSEQPKGSVELAKFACADPGIVLRTLRVLSAARVVRPVGRDSFCSTAFSTATSHEDFANGVRWKLDTNAPALLSTPAYLRERNWQTPLDPLRSALTAKYPALNGEKEAAFQVWDRVGPKNGLFSLLKAWMANVAFWADEEQGFYPFTKRLVEGSSEDVALLVDIGCGSGSDMRNLLRLHPSVTRLVLQDTPTVIENLKSVDVPSQVRLMSHDFFVSTASSPGVYLPSMELIHFAETSADHRSQDLLPA